MLHARWFDSSLKSLCGPTTIDLARVQERLAYRNTPQEHNPTNPLADKRKHMVDPGRHCKPRTLRRPRGMLQRRRRGPGCMTKLRFSEGKRSWAISDPAPGGRDTGARLSHSECKERRKRYGRGRKRTRNKTSTRIEEKYKKQDMEEETEDGG